MDEQLIKERIKEYLYSSTMRGLLMPKDRYQLLDEVEKYNVDEDQLNRLIMEVQVECGFATGPSQSSKRKLGNKAEASKKVAVPSFAKTFSSIKLGPKSIITVVLVLVLISLATVYFILGPEAFNVNQQQAGVEEKNHDAAVESNASMKEAVAQDLQDPPLASLQKQPKAVAESASLESGSSKPLIRKVAVANSLEEHLVQLSNDSLSFQEREQLAHEAMKYFSENAQVLIYTKGERTGRESIADYLDILLLQKYKVTVNDKHTNNEGKITQLSVVEQY